MRWLEPARGEEFRSDLKCDRPGAEGCGSIFLVGPVRGNSVMPQLSDCPHHSLLNILLHSSFQQLFREALLWIGIILGTEPRTIHKTMALSSWSFLVSSVRRQNINEETDYIQNF